MKRLATYVICLLLMFAQCAMAQQDNGDDVYGIPASAKKNRDFIKDKTLVADKPLPGYITLTTNEVMRGLVECSGKVILQDTVNNKITKYKLEDVKSFVTGADTFRVYLDTVYYTHKQKGGSEMSGKQVYTYIYREMIYGAKLSLYKHVRYLQSSGGMPMGGGFGPGGFGAGVTVFLPSSGSYRISFYLKAKNDNKYVEIPSGKNAFKKFMVLHLKDNADLLKKINSDVYTYEDIDHIITEYNNKS